MPFIELITTRNKNPGRGKKVKRTIRYVCDQCQESFDMPYTQGDYQDAFEQTRSFFCSKICANASLRKGGVTASKIEETCLKVYGHRSSAMNSDIKEKVRSTNIVRYGTEVPSQSDVVKLKMRETCQQRYGVDYVMQSGEFKEVSKQTFRRKYGADSFQQSVVGRETISNTLKSEKTQSLRLSSMKRNGTLGSGKSMREDLLYESLVAIFGEVERHVPIHRWNVDFYIPCIKTYLNFNGDYWHGKTLKEGDERNSHRKIILETVRRDSEREAWFKENNIPFIVIWEGDFMDVEPTDREQFCRRSLGI